MKELEKLTPTEQHQEVQQRQEYRFLGELNHAKGLIMYEYDPENKILKRAEIVSPPKTEEVDFKKHQQPKKAKGQLWNPEYMIAKHAEENKRVIGRILYRKGHDYFQALNDKSAQVKLDKMIRRGLIGR